MTEDHGPNSFRALVDMLRPHWRLVAVTTAAVLVVSVVATLVKERTYTATAAFMSQARRQNGGLTSLAAQLGVGVGDAGAESPQFYVDLVSRQSTLRALVDSSYPGSSGKRYRNLVEYFGISASNYAVARDRAVTKLRRRLDASANAKTGVITLTVTSPDPVMARALADRAIAVVNEFNLQRRKSQAAAERDFVEERLAQALAELHVAENRQEAFLQTNAVVTSPRLRLEADRLSQEVGTRRALYTTLSQSYEQARIDAVRDTPVITVIEAPVVPAEPDSRGLARAIIFALFGGMVLGIMFAYWRAMWQHTASAGV